MARPALAALGRGGIGIAARSGMRRVDCITLERDTTAQQSLDGLVVTIFALYPDQQEETANERGRSATAFILIATIDL